jgi:inorganic pyrophosphatase
LLEYEHARHLVTRLTLLCSILLALPAPAQDSSPPRVLPPLAAAILAKSLAAAEPHRAHVWRDTPPINTDGTVNAYIEIARGDRRKWEFDMSKNARAIDRMIPEALGGYPVNYGFVPQTVSYDGDPFDALVLGPALPGGTLTKGIAVGVMFMEDEKGLDSKIVLSRVDAAGRPVHRLTAADEREMTAFFRRYKDHEPGGFSRVPGWGSAAEGLAFVRTTHAFYSQCRNSAGTSCVLR